MPKKLRPLISQSTKPDATRQPPEFLLCPPSAPRDYIVKDLYILLAGSVCLRLHEFTIKYEHQ